MKTGLCKENEIGSYILASNATERSKFPLVSTSVHLKKPKPIKYEVGQTGFYCVSTYSYSGEEYKGVVSFRNAYGELPATQIPKLPFYGALAIVYAVVFAYVIALRYNPGFILIVLGSGHSCTSNIDTTFVSFYFYNSSCRFTC